MYPVIINGIYFGLEISKEYLASFNLENELKEIREVTGFDFKKIDKIEFRYNPLLNY